jgi:uncharacterized protein DUF5829
MTAAAAPVLLNHFYVTADRGTFEAVEREEAARRLGAWEKRTTIRKDLTYTGLYLYGENTYLELLHPDSKLGAPAGIAWHGSLGDSVLIYRGDAPWFRLSEGKPPLEGLSDWGMEYVPDFFKTFRPELPPLHPGTERSDALTRYAASCGKLRERSEGLFEDVTALEVTLAPADLEIWRRRAPRVQGAEIRVTPGPRTAITAAELTLRRDAGRGEARLGSTTLSLDGRRAVWRF